jgi:hypothetical protein
MLRAKMYKQLKKQPWLHAQSVELAIWFTLRQTLKLQPGWESKPKNLQRELA